MVLGDFDKELFDKCKELTNRVMDVVFCLTIKKYPQTKPKLKDDMSIYWFKELDASLTLQILVDNS